MSNLEQIARRIPGIIRSQRLLVPADPIGVAIAANTNPAMKLLFNIWYEFIEPGGGNINCPSCLLNVLDNFRALKPVLLDLEREQKLLNEL